MFQIAIVTKITAPRLLKEMSESNSYSCNHSMKDYKSKSVLSELIGVKSIGNGCLKPEILVAGFFGISASDISKEISTHSSTQNKVFHSKINTSSCAKQVLTDIRIIELNNLLCAS